jgi:hypothetical protein
VIGTVIAEDQFGGNYEEAIINSHTTFDRPVGRACVRFEE